MLFLKRYLAKYFEKKDTYVKKINKKNETTKMQEVKEVYVEFCLKMFVLVHEIIYLDTCYCIIGFLGKE